MLTTIGLCALLLAGVCTGQGARTTEDKSCGLNNRCVLPALCNNSRARAIRLNILEVSRCRGIEVCCPINEIIAEPPHRQQKERKRNQLHCGHRNPLGLMGMMATNMTAPEAGEAEFGEFPWAIAVLEVKQSGGYLMVGFLCGGSLIHPRVVLTAAHYMYNGTASSFRVRAGEWDPHSTDEPHPHQDRRVKEIVVHDKFDSARLTYDAALLILKTSFDITPHINPICLPNAEMIPNSATCFVAGWGTKAFQRHLYSDKLKKIELQVLPRDECNDKLKRTRLGIYYALHSSFICAGGEGAKDACTGDGGSALMCPIPNNEEYYYQAGIVSWGIHCGQPDVPGIYMNVLMARSWIDSVLIEKNLIE